MAAFVIPQLCLCTPNSKKSLVVITNFPLTQNKADETTKFTINLATHWLWFYTEDNPKDSQLFLTDLTILDINYNSILFHLIGDVKVAGDCLLLQHRSQLLLQCN